MPQMFSLDEMRELALAFPDASSRAFPESDQEVRLVPSLSGDGFIRSDVLLQKLNEHIESGTLNHLTRLPAELMCTQTAMDAFPCLSLLLPSTFPKRSSLPW